MLRVLAVGSVALGLVCGSAALAVADDTTGNVPRIVSDSEYVASGAADPRERVPVGEPAAATGQDVNAYVGLLEGISGSQISAPPQVEEFSGNGEALSIALEADDTDTFVTRTGVDSDIPRSVLDDGTAGSTLETLPTGTQLLSAADAETGAMVSTLSPQGQLTVWNAPGDFQDDRLATLKRWATEADSKDPGPLGITKAAGTVTVQAAPTCSLSIHKPSTSDRMIKASSSLVCNQKGDIRLKGYLLQYRALGIWVSKASEEFSGPGASATVVTAEWKCSVGDNQLYRGRASTRQLKNSNGTWYKSGQVDGPEQRLTCRA